MRFELLFPGLARLGLPIPLGGTSNHFRMSELGGWDAWNVTEGADLGMRCAALGYASTSSTRSRAARCRPPARQLTLHVEKTPHRLMPRR